MINDKNLNQTGGDNSTNFQGQNITVNNGISYDDAKDIALDVFKSNFIELSNKASETATKRAEQLIDNFLTKLKQTNSKTIEKFQDPDIQYVIYSAQKEYARSGEENLEALLVDILTERIEESTNTLRKIVLNEAIEIVPKLTNQQLDILTLIFILNDTQDGNLSTPHLFQIYLNNYLIPFMSMLTEEKSCYRHLEFLGCCSTIGIPNNNLSNILISRYKSVFSKGFKREEFERITGNNPNLNFLLKPCFNDTSLFQLNIPNNEVLKQVLSGLYNQDDKIFFSLNNLIDKSTMNNNEAEKLLISMNPSIEILIDTWRNSYMCSLKPTTVGMALAYINLKKKTNINLNLETWIK